MIWIWIGFLILVLGMLALDLGVFHRHAHAVRLKEALTWSGVWLGMALGFAVFVFFAYDGHWGGLGSAIHSADGIPLGGKSAAVKYLTGYVLEKSLSVDNLFVISMLFASFAVPTIHQHRVLFWGIIGAILMRGAMIGVGVELISHFHWILYLFGIFLIVTAVKMVVTKIDHSNPAQTIIVRYARKIFRVTDQFHGAHFVVRTNPSDGSGTRGAFAITPLALALIAIEAADLLFAVDSIPAIFAITTDPFLVFTSNVFAILGLRSLYFALAGMIERFRYLKVSLAVVLAVVGGKLLVANWLKERFGPGTDLWFLALVSLILLTGVVASWIADRRQVRGISESRGRDDPETSTENRSA